MSNQFYNFFDSKALDVQKSVILSPQMEFYYLGLFSNE